MYVYSIGLDGLSLMNMSCEDFNDLGVTNPLHLRRLQIALQPYRLKFKDKQASAIGVMNTHSGNSYDDTAEVNLGKQHISFKYLLLL